MELNNRKPNRLKSYDYTTAGAYHITICTLGRKEYFRKNGTLTVFGKIAEEKIAETAEKYNIVIKYFKIMPDHVHMLIENYYLLRTDKEVVSISKIVAHYKAVVQIECRKKADEMKIAMDKLWQRSFYDHIIRGERDYYETIKYITYNDLK